MCVPLYNYVKPILKFISIQEVFISIFNSDSVVKNNQNQKAGKVSQPFLKTVNLGALSIWEPSTRTKLRKFWNLGLSIYSINPADPASFQPEPEPEPDWKKMAGLAGTGTGFPVAHCRYTGIPTAVKMQVEFWDLLKIEPT